MGGHHILCNPLSLLLPHVGNKWNVFSLLFSLIVYVLWFENLIYYRISYFFCQSYMYKVNGKAG